MINLRANIRIIIVILVAILFIVFLLQNTATTPVKLLFFEGEIPSVVLILVTTLAGFAVGYFMAATRQRARQKAEDQKEETAE